MDVTQEASYFRKEKMVRQFEIALVFSTLVETLSMTMVVPSLLFYVMQNGGSKDHYGLIMSSFMFASFCVNPFLGTWSESRGFRSPFLLSQLLNVLGGLTYAIASAFSKGYPALVVILMGRLLAGVGGSCSTLTFAYMARVGVTGEQQAKSINLLQLVSLLGTMFGPVPNFLLRCVDFEIGSYRVDKLNSVGLVVALLNLFSLGGIYLYLDEIPNLNDNESPPTSGDDQDKEEKNRCMTSTTVDMIKATVSSPHIMVNIVLIFVVTSAFQLMDTAITPAAKDGLGWEPAGVSVIFAIFGVIMYFNNLIMFRLMDLNFRIETILTFGMIAEIIGFVFMYIMWTSDAHLWEFLFPLIILASAASYISVPSQSLYTLACGGNESLVANQEVMQGFFVNMISFAAFVSPFLSAIYAIRSPEEVDVSEDGREMKRSALIAPVSLVLCLLAHLLVEYEKPNAESDTEGALNEKTSLMGGGNADSPSIMW